MSNESSGGAAYSGTKAALAAMTRTWAAEFSPSGVRVNTVAPGPVATEAIPADRIDALGATTVLSRAAQPTEIAPVVAFLASPMASYVTGAFYAVDGGSGAQRNGTLSCGAPHLPRSSFQKGPTPCLT